MVTHEELASKGKPVDHFETHNVKVAPGVSTFKLAKEQVIHIEGKVHTESFTDAGGIRRYKTDVIASRIVRLSPPEVKVAGEVSEDERGVNR